MEMLTPILMRELSLGMTETALYRHCPLFLNASPREIVHLQHKASENVKSYFPTHILMASIEVPFQHSEIQSCAKLLGS